MTRLAPAAMVTGPLPMAEAVMEVLLVSTVPALTLRPPAPAFAALLRTNRPEPDLVSAPVKVTTPDKVKAFALTVRVRAAPTVVAPDRVNDCEP